MTNQLPLAVTAPFSRAQRAALFNLIIRAAKSEIMPRFRKLDQGDILAKSGPNDLVTQADTAAEAVITRGLQIAFPNAVIIGEEAAEAKVDYRKSLAEAELGFLIDPVDGTWNFAKGLPLFGTMVAATRFGRPVFGAIYDPIGQDFFWADIDHDSVTTPQSGAPRSLSTRTDTQLPDMIGYAELGFMPPQHRKHASEACLHLTSTSSLRCSAHQYRLLAQGAVDFNLATKLSAWDHAAGVLLCQRAGGHAAMLDGTPYDTSQDQGYLLCAGSKQSWDLLANHFSGLLTPDA